MNGQGDFDASGYIPNPRIMGRAEDDESDTIDAKSNCDNQQDGGRMRRGHRHTVSQIQELENFFKTNSHPTEDQRNELGQRLNMEAKQIKYWFHNKRTQMKIHRDRHEHGALREEHARLLGARDQLICRLLLSACNNICGTAANHYPNFLSDPVHLPVSPSEPRASSSSSSLMVSNPRKNATPELYMGGGTTTVKERSKFLDLAVKAMNELTMLGEKDSPLWKTDLRSNNVSLRYDTYKSVFSNVMKPPGHVVEASRDMGLVPMTCVNLVKTFMDTGNWVNVFAPIVPVAPIRKVISTGSPGTKSGSLQLIQAEFQVISPLVPKRQVTFLRYCKEITPGSWVVVDVTPVQHYPNFLPYGGSNRLPSGLIIKDMGNGYSKVTWIEQAEYDETHLHQLYQPLIGSGIGLGAKRWLATLQRYCETLSSLTASTNLNQINPGLSAKGATELVKLARRMTLNYYTGITGSSADKWEILQVENVAQNMRFMTRKNVNKPGEPTGIVLSAATSVWFPVNQQTLFAFLCHPSLRHEWDILTHNTSVEQTTLIRKAKRQENIISLLKIIANGMLVLQEVWNDASGAMVVYAPVETNSMEPVLRGENSDSVQLLASGFSILPDGVTESDHRGKCKIGGGCVMTLGLQILVSSNPAAELTQGSVRTAKELMVHTISKIKSSLDIQT